MSLHTPVVLTDDPAIAAAARERHWLVVARDADTLRMSNVTQTAPMPEPRMDIAGGSLSGPTAAGWKFVLDWIVKYALRPALVVEQGGWATELAAWARAARGWPTLDASALDALPADALLEIPKPPVGPSNADRLHGGRVLIVGHGEPTARLMAWAAAAESAGLTVDIASDRPIDRRARVHVVEDLGVAALAAGGTIDPHTALALTRAVENREPSLGVAGHWQTALERWFGARDDEFDVVVLTGPPVAYLGFGAFANRRWYARVLIDHASHAPWPVDPDESATAQDWQRGWHLAADAVTIADPELAPLVPASGPDDTVELIATNDTPAMTRLLASLADHSL